MSDLICDLARTEDCVIMGRCADSILTNNHIPHLSIFISAPFPLRVQRIMASKNMDLRHASRFLKQMDRQHQNIMISIHTAGGDIRKTMICASTAPITGSGKPLI